MLPQRGFNILFCTDFCLPAIGGVEMHQFYLGQCLVEMGHKVVVITNAFRYERVGLFYLPNGIKVYNFPQLPVIAGNVGFLSMWQNYAAFR